MKLRLNILLIAAVGTMSAQLTSCSDDNFTDSIFDTTEYPLDRTVYTFPLDTFVKAEFLVPYNVQFIYKTEDKGLSSSDMAKNFTPAPYDNCVKLAVLSKYLWHDVYKKHAGVEFLKENSPRIIHVIGSKSYNVSQGTETLGVAEGGLKISLFNVNNLDEGNIDMMNEYFFKTMHHEFGHILDQTHLRPTAFNLVSNGQYDASGWSETPDSVAAGRGFVSPYASSATGEDWVEVLANYITRDSISWNNMLNTANYEWEIIDIESYSAYTKRLSPGCNLDTIGYYQAMNNGDSKLYRRVCKRNADDTVALDENGEVVWTHASGIDGHAIILKKLEMVREWLKTYFGADIDDLRTEVQQRQYVTNSDGTFLIQNGRLVNRLTYPTSSGKTTMEELVDEVNQFKSLMN